MQHEKLFVSQTVLFASFFLPAIHLKIIILCLVERASCALLHYDLFPFGRMAFVWVNLMCSFSSNICIDRIYFYNFIRAAEWFICRNFPVAQIQTKELLWNSLKLHFVHFFMGKNSLQNILTFASVFEWKGGQSNRSTWMCIYSVSVGVCS